MIGNPLLRSGIEEGDCATRNREERSASAPISLHISEIGAEAELFSWQ